jgi:hypothetical protein
MPEDTQLFPVKQFSISPPGTQNQVQKMTPQPQPPTPVAPIDPAPPVPQKPWVS